MKAKAMKKKASNGKCDMKHEREEVKLLNKMQKMHKGVKSAKKKSKK